MTTIAKGFCDRLLVPEKHFAYAQESILANEHLAVPHSIIEREHWIHRTLLVEMHFAHAQEYSRFIELHPGNQNQQRLKPGVPQHRHPKGGSSPASYPTQLGLDTGGSQNWILPPGESHTGKRARSQDHKRLAWQRACPTRELLEGLGAKACCLPPPSKPIFCQLQCQSLAPFPAQSSELPTRLCPVQETTVFRMYQGCCLTQSRSAVLELTSIL